MLTIDPIARSWMYGLDWTVSVILFCFEMVTENVEDCCAFATRLLWDCPNGQNSTVPSIPLRYPDEHESQCILID